VLQAIYEFAPSAFPAFVGKQIDVFIADASGDTQAYLAPNQVRRGARQPMQAAGRVSRTPVGKISALTKGS